MSFWEIFIYTLSTAEPIFVLCPTWSGDKIVMGVIHHMVTCPEFGVSDRTCHMLKTNQMFIRA